MNPTLQSAIATLDEVVAGWTTPRPIPGYPHHIDLQPEALLRIAAHCGALEGSAHGDHRLQFTLGKIGEARAHKVYEVRDASGKLRSVLARLASVIDEMREPGLVALEFDTSTAAEKRKYELRQNSVHGFETRFQFETGSASVMLHVESSNGVQTNDISGIGFRITA